MALKIDELSEYDGKWIFTREEVYGRAFYPYEEEPYAAPCSECHKIISGTVFSISSEDPPLNGRRCLVCQTCLGKFINHYEEMERKFDTEITLHQKEGTLENPIIIE